MEGVRKHRHILNGDTLRPQADFDLSLINFIYIAARIRRLRQQIRNIHVDAEFRENGPQRFVLQRTRHPADSVGVSRVKLANRIPSVFLVDAHQLPKHFGLPHGNGIADEVLAIVAMPLKPVAGYKFLRCSTRRLILFAHV